MRAHDTGDLSSNPTSVTMKIPLGRNATGNCLIKPTSLEKFRAMYLVSVTLEIEYATQ